MREIETRDGVPVIEGMQVFVIRGDSTNLTIVEAEVLDDGSDDGGLAPAATVRLRGGLVDFLPGYELFSTREAARQRVIQKLRKVSAEANKAIAKWHRLRAANIVAGFWFRKVGEKQVYVRIHESCRLPNDAVWAVNLTTGSLTKIDPDHAVVLVRKRLP